MKLTKYLAAAAAVAIAGSFAWGAGIFQTLPILGGAAYCAASNVSGAAQGGVTGQGGGVATAGQTTGTVICQSNAPAGPATFTGTEVVPMDIYAPGTANIGGGAQTMLANINQLGTGTITVNTTAGNATVPNNTSWYMINVGNTTATFTLPSAPIQNQIVHFDIVTAQTTSWVVGANAGQTCLPACPFSNATVAAGTGEGWIWNAANTTWYKIY